MAEYQFSFEKLETWKASRILVKSVYNVLRSFPAQEKYGLVDQLKRAVVSVPSNIAEGCSRASVKEKAHFMEIAYGSLMEVYCQLLLSYDLSYIREEELRDLRNQIFTVSKLLSGLKNSMLVN